MADPHQRLGLAILLQAIDDARAINRTTDEEVRERAEEAMDWLTCEPNPVRHLIVEGASQIHQDDLDNLVEGIRNGTNAAR